MSQMLLTSILLPSQGGSIFGGSSLLYDHEWIVDVLFLLVFGVGGLASIAGIIYIWIRALKQPTLALGLANCGNCRYAVRGAAAMTCPECGCDFREVGILSPTMRKPFIGPTRFLVIWSLCLWIPGANVSSVIIMMGPHDPVPYEDVDVDPPDTKIAGYDNITFSRTPYGMYGDMYLPDYVATSSDYIDIDIYGPNANEWYEINLVKNTYENYNASGSNPQPFSRKALETWVANVGGKIKEPDVQKQIDQAYNNIIQTPTAGLAGANWTAFSTNSKSNYFEHMPAIWFVILQPFLWLIVYLAGVVTYVLLKKRYDNTMQKLREQALIQTLSTQAGA